MLLWQLLWLPVCFLCGALPTAVWLGRLAGVDIRQYGDGNPGATNVLRAAGQYWFALALCAEFSKAAVPVGLAYYVFQWEGWILWPIAWLPAVGHVFSPFLGGQGGKALAAILGSWIGLTLWVIPAVLLFSVTFFFGLIRGEAWVVVCAGVVTLLFMWLQGYPPLFMLIFLSQLALALWTHRADFKTRPELRLKGKKL